MAQFDVLIGYLDVGGAQEIACVSPAAAVTSGTAHGPVLAAVGALGIAPVWVDSSNKTAAAKLATVLGVPAGQPDGWGVPVVPDPPDGAEEPDSRGGRLIVGGGVEIPVRAKKAMGIALSRRAQRAVARQKRAR